MDLADNKNEENYVFSREFILESPRTRKRSAEAQLLLAHTTIEKTFNIFFMNRSWSK